MLAEPWLIHSRKLEDKVCHSAEEEDNGDNHPKQVFASGRPGCREEDEDRNWDSSDCERHLSGIGTGNNDQELDGESEKEEEVELQKGNVNLEMLDITQVILQGTAYLECQETTLHSEIRTNVFVDCPGELIIEFPGHECHHAGEEAYNDWNGQQEGLDIFPNCGIRLDVLPSTQPIDSSPNLVVLDRCVYQHADVINTETDDLNSVLHTQGIPDKYQLVEETEDEECEVCRDRFR